MACPTGFGPNDGITLQSIPVSVDLPIQVSIYLLSIYLYLSIIYVPIIYNLCIYLYISTYLYLSSTYIYYLYLYIYVSSIYLSLSIIYLYLYLYICIYMYLSSITYVSISICLCIYIYHLPISIYYLYLSISMCHPSIYLYLLFISISISVCISVSISISIYASIIYRLYFCLCHPLSILCPAGSLSVEPSLTRRVQWSCPARPCFLSQRKDGLLQGTRLRKETDPGPWAPHVLSVPLAPQRKPVHSLSRAPVLTDLGRIPGRSPTPTSAHRQRRTDSPRPAGSRVRSRAARPRAVPTRAREAHCLEDAEGPFAVR
uniref:Uncharacterized protein n=1 Tax=Myotis myotis TaxID=51298 RepID=A0A7J7V3J8_MYOMY|nr:hypothetical protein mMyoMyo1_008422 [Myotis myotis]